MELAPPPLVLLPFHEKGVDESPPVSPDDDHFMTQYAFDAVSVAEQVAITMGIPDIIIQMARDFQLLEHKTNFSDATQLFEAAEGLMKNPGEQARVAKKLFEAEQAKREESTDLVSGKVPAEEACVLGEVSACLYAKMQERQAEAKPTMDGKAQLKEKVKRLARENHRLRQRKLCRKCKEVDLATNGVTFLPCGHFITCEACSEAYEVCPACGKSIMGTVRTFLS